MHVLELLCDTWILNNVKYFLSILIIIIIKIKKKE